LQNVRSANSSWMTGHGFEPVPQADNASEFGLALFQLVVREIDTKVQCRPGDLVATVAFLTGRIVQRSAFHDAPDSFVVDRSANGILVMRSDWVSNRLGTLEPGSLASVLVDSAILFGARTFPDFAAVRQDAFEAMQRRGTFDLRGHILTATPEELAAEVQSDVDGLLFDAADRTLLIHASINACGHAIGYARHRLPPVEAAELALSVAFYAGWVDQRKIGRAQLRS
jgi:hypothetical protein